MNYKFLMFFMLLIGLTFNVSAQEKYIVKGRVVNGEDNKPLEKVFVTINQGGKTLAGNSITDDKGKFTVTVPKGASLVFTYLGFEPIVKNITGSTDNLSVTMKVEVNQLKDVVVVNYQQKKREEVTGSAVTISGKDLQDVPVTNVLQLMQGRVAGLNIQNNNGAPGASGTITIRGISNIDVQGSGDQALLTPTSPLYVIDGIPVDDPSTFQYGFNQAGAGLNPLSLIPQQDIEEITILKDAQSTSLYGSAGAYGVILVTTKRGKSSVPRISYSTSFSVNNPPALRKVIVGRGERMSRINQIITQDTSAVHAYSLINQNAFLSDSLNVYYNNATDWQKIFYKTTYSQSHNISASGGKEELNYSVNGGYSDTKGIIKNTGFTRYALNMNVGYKPNSKFSMRSSIRSSLGERNKGSGNALAQSGVASASNTSSLLPAPSIYTASNAALGVASIKNENKSVGVSANIDMSYNFFPWLRLQSATGYSYSTSTEDTFTPLILNNGYGKVYAYNSTGETLYNRSSLSFSKTIKENHNLNLYVNEEINTSKTKGNTITQTGLPNDQIYGPVGYSQLNSTGSANSGIESRSASFAVAGSYNYMTKYIIDLSYRLSGGSTSGPDVPWTKSPSIGLRYNFYKEPFIEKLNIFSNASMRGSWGKTIIPTGTVYNIYGRYSTDATKYNNQTSIALDLTDIPNSALIPSTNTQLNYGMDFGFSNNRYSLSFDTYYRQSDNILRRKLIATHDAFLGVNTNETSIVNYGYEVSFSAHLLPASYAVSWTFSINGAINKDVLAALPDGKRQFFTGASDAQPIVNRIGGNALSNYLYNNTGVYQSTLDVPVDPLTGLRYRTGGTLDPGRFFRAGDPIWTDVNGDYILDNNDRVIVGNSQPRFTGGFQTGVRYKGFAFSTSATIVLKRDIINSALAERFQTFANPLTQNALVPISSYNFYTPQNTNATYPNPYDFTRYTLYNPFRPDQTLFQEDGSYLKINSISLSYNFDNANIVKKLGVSSMRFNFSVSNIYTFTKYSGVNPETVSSLGRDTSGGYPNSRDFSLGLDVQF